MRISVLVAVLAITLVSFVQAQMPTEEREALIALYNSTDGPNWTNNTNWLGAVGTECTWFGVYCSLDDQVTQLILPTNKLNGSLPPEIGDLPILFLLHMWANQLSGSLPPELGDLSNLQQIKLYNNDLSGSIPPELGQLSKLSWLSLYNNDLTGSIPPELGDLSSLQQLILFGNQLTGVIPPDLGDLTNLAGLKLEANQLSGSIPPELGKLSSLYSLSLYLNQLSGSIPPELGDLSGLVNLHLHLNQLTGSIPPELGQLALLQQLYLYSNKLRGDIPAELEDLTALLDGSGLRMKWNALHSDNATLIAFLDGKSPGGEWQSTQTIAPVNLTFDRVGDHTVWLSWDAVSYLGDSGGYEVFYAPTGSGVWSSGGWTEDKEDITFPVTGLDPGTIYDLAVVTYTDPHDFNQNLVHSDFSLEVMPTTASAGCPQPIVQQTEEDPITLSLSESFDSYVWSTGETTSSIDVDAQLWQWYWVTVTSAGPCEETASTWVGPPIPFFADGFESGATTAWSSTFP